MQRQDNNEQDLGRLRLGSAKHGEEIAQQEEGRES